MQVEVVGIKFNTSSHLYSFIPNDLELKRGDYVVVESDKGQAIGCVAKERYMLDVDELAAPLRNVIKVATPEMLKKAEEYNKKAQEYYPKISKMVRDSGLDMKVVRVEASFDNSKIIVNFSADTRVDFRDLVKKLAETLKTRVELRQVGSRDAVAMLGGYGPCGKECCCVQGFCEIDHVSMKMAKNQDLSLNPNTISGLCGKLMCCLAYENPMYVEALKVMPPVGSEVSTKDGNGKVVYNYLLARRVDVKFMRGEEEEIKTYDLSEIKVKNHENK